MGWDGMLAKAGGAPCSRCGKPLNPNGDRPAELYAGTFTGICYSCERRGVEQVAIDPLDGAICMEYPPHCPSWRRDREQYWGYKDCPDCKGECSEWVFRAYTRGGSYRSYCETCHNKSKNHPTRKWSWQRSVRLRRAAEARFDKAKDQYKKKNQIKKRDPLPTEVLDELRVPIISEYKRLETKWKTLLNKRRPQIIWSDQKGTST